MEWKYTSDFSAEMIQKVWDKAEVIPDRDPLVFRRDSCGAIIKRDLYQKDAKPLSMGWQINHIKPVQKGGKNNLANLQALQWENDLNKKDNEYFWACKVTNGATDNKYCE